MIKKVRDTFYSVLVVLFIALIWTYSPIGDVSRSFIKLPGIVPIYSWIFFGLLLVLLVVLHEKIERGSWLKVSLYSSIFGYLLCLFSLGVAQFLVTSGGEHIANSFETVGAGGFLVVQFLMAGVLAGWLYGLLSALGVKAISKFLKR